MQHMPISVSVTFNEEPLSSIASIFENKNFSILRSQSDQPNKFQVCHKREGTLFEAWKIKSLELSQGLSSI